MATPRSEVERPVRAPSVAQTRPGQGVAQSRPAFAILALALLSVLLYARTLEFGFPLDDEVHVVRNLDIRDLGRSLGAFMSPTWPGNLYRPLATLSYGLTHAAFGQSSIAHHAVNVLLNAAVVVLAYLCLLRLVAVPLALATAFLFALHPLHVEVVASIANRTEMLAVLAGLSALWLLLPDRAGARGVRPLRIAAAALLLLIALLAKESALVFLPLALLCLWWVRRDSPRALVYDLPALTVLSSAVVLYLALRVVALGAIVPPKAEISGIDNPLVLLPASERVVRAILLLGKYVALVLAPASPSADYSLGTPGLAENFGSPETWLYAGFLALVALTALAGVARRHVAGLFAAWFLVAFAVTANVAFPIGTIFADRLTYLPGLGLCGLLAWALLQIRSAPLRSTVFASLALAFALRTISYTVVWRDTTSVFAYEIATSPESVKVQNGWAEALGRAGRLQEARERFRAVLAVYPGYTNAALGLGVLALKEGDRVAAEEWLTRALEIDPKHVPTLVLLGRVVLRQGDVERAGKLFARALSADNESFDARLGLLAASLELGSVEHAARLHRDLRALDPDHPELEGMGRALEAQRVSRDEAGALPPPPRRGAGRSPGRVRS